MRLLFIIFLLLLPSGHAKVTDELVVALQARIEQEESFDDIVEAIGDLPVAEIKSFSAEFEKGWSPLRSKYFVDLKSFIDSKFKTSDRNERNRRVKELREEFHRVRRLGEGAMKKELGTVSMPALTELRTLLMPDSKTLLEDAPESLVVRRKMVHGFAKFRDDLLEVGVSRGENGTYEKLLAEEAALAEEYSDLDRAQLRILEKNDKEAEEEQVPAKEREGIRQLNEWRLLLGQRVLVIDPKLCDASRDHSKDMEEHNFFSHTSPLPGKSSPSQRAKLAGTSGGGENIYMGSNSPKSANKGWFFSPGHHKNMFNSRYKRIGLGNHNRHWTQMFGG